MTTAATVVVKLSEGEWGIGEREIDKLTNSAAGSWIGFLFLA